LVYNLFVLFKNIYKDTRLNKFKLIVLDYVDLF